MSEKYLTITNADETPVTRYGVTVQPGESTFVDVDVVIAYSLMEISLAAQHISRKAGKNDLRLEEAHNLMLGDRLSGKAQPVYVRNLPDEVSVFKIGWLRKKARRVFKIR